jgi:GT2 family glycosyltransferase
VSADSHVFTQNPDARDEWPQASLVVLNWNGRQWLRECISSLLALDYPAYEIILVDNGSTDGSVEFVRQRFPQVRLIANEENLGFSKGMNVGLQQAQGDVIVLLNNDLYVRPDWLRALNRPIVADESVGIVGCKLLFPDEQTIQHAGARLVYPVALSHHYGYGEIDEGQYDQVREVDYVTGAAMAIARRVLDDIGGLDEGFSPFYYEETDFCYRARAAGYRVLYIPDAVGIHHESVSVRLAGPMRLRAFHKNRLRFVLKHYTMDQFISDFAPAEAARLEETTSAEDLHAARRGYLEAMLILPELLQRRTSPAEMGQIRRALEELREAALRRRITVYGPMPEGWYRQELIDRQVLQEPGFHSDVPMIGPLIAGFRETWNNVSTKWYVRLILQQQVAFNRLAAALLDDLSSQAGASASDLTLLAGELTRMNRCFEEVLSHVRDEMAGFRERLERVEDALERTGWLSADSKDRQDET